jgi:hypothetical protein
MSLSLVQSRALLGLDAAAVTVEVHLANGLPSFTLVGLADVEVKEARERVRCAILNSGLDFPNNKRILCSQALFLRYAQGSDRWCRSSLDHVCVPRRFKRSKGGGRGVGNVQGCQRLQGPRGRLPPFAAK